MLFALEQMHKNSLYVSLYHIFKYEAKESVKLEEKCPLTR